MYVCVSDGKDREAEGSVPRLDDSEKAEGVMSQSENLGETRVCGERERERERERESVWGGREREILTAWPTIGDYFQSRGQGITIMLY